MRLYGIFKDIQLYFILMSPCSPYMSHEIIVLLQYTRNEQGEEEELQFCSCEDPLVVLGVVTSELLVTI